MDKGKVATLVHRLPRCYHSSNAGGVAKKAAVRSMWKRQKVVSGKHNRINAPWLVRISFKSLTRRLPAWSPDQHPHIPSPFVP